MKNLWKFARICTMALMCVFFLGFGIKAEAAPGQVTGVKQTNDGTGYVYISWDAVIGNDIEYKVELCADKNFTSGVMDNLNYNSSGKISGGTSSTTESFSGLTAGKKYYVRVTAFTDTGYPDYVCTFGQPSSVLEVVTKPTEKVQNIKETKATETSITLSWSKTAGANAYQIECRKVGADASSVNTVYVGNVTSYTAAKLSKNAEYYFDIAPVNLSASGYKSIGYGTGIYNVPTLPTKVTGLDSEFWSLTSNYLELEYAARNSADGYQYQVYTVDGKKKLVDGKAASTSPYFSSSKLKGYKFMKVRVRAYININGKAKYGAWSAWDYFARQPKIESKNTKSGIKISWSKVAGAKNYVVYVSTKKDSGYKKLTTTTKTSTTIKKCGKASLKSGKTYYYYVVANKKVGNKTYKSDTGYCWSVTYRK